LSRDEWLWLEQRWQLAFSPPPRRTHGATVVWSDAALRAQMSDFVETRTWNTHRLLFHLMAAGAALQNTVRVEDAPRARGALLVPNAHLFPTDELDRVMEYRGGPIVLVGRKTGQMPTADGEFSDVYPPNEMWCGVYRASPGEVAIVDEGEETPLADLKEIIDPRSYWDHLTYRKVSTGFIKACAATLQRVSTPINVVKESDSVAVMPVELCDGRIRIAIKNRKRTYCRPEIDVGRPVESVEVRTSFPSVAIRPKGSTFSVRVPGRGVTVVDVLTDVE
jgi:hypothetical protein